MATTLGNIRYKARNHLLEKAPSFWSDDELLGLIRDGIYEMWRAVQGVNEEHYLTVDTTNVTLAADTATLSGVPTDTFRVLLIQPSDTTDSGSHKHLVFSPVEYNSDEFKTGLATSTVDPSQGGVINYAISNAGAPSGTTIIHVAPKVSAAISLRFVYIPTLTPGDDPCTASLLGAEDANPIPGHSDHALVAWTVAYALAKQREDNQPDPGWLGIYATEKEAILTSLAPRQSQEPTFVKAVFEANW